MTLLSVFLSLSPVLAAPATVAVPPPLQGQPSMVRTDPVQVASLQDRRFANGELRAARRSHVAGEEAGRIVELLVDEGTRVERGAVLARIDATRLELELSVLKAQTAVAEALVDERGHALTQEHRDLEAVRRLVERDATNAKELADAETAVAEAQARLAQAEQERAVLAARTKLLVDRVADTEVHAPFAGTIASVAVEAGEWLAAGSSVAELVSDELEVWVEVPQRHLAALRVPKGPLSVTAAAGTSAFESELWRVVPDVDPGARMLTVIASLAPNPALAPGMSAVAWVPIAERADHKTVAVDALLQNELGPYLFVAVPGTEGSPWNARPVQVEVLWREGGRAVVRGPLKAGDAAIVEGKQRLYPMAPVQPIDAVPTADSGVTSGE